MKLRVKTENIYLTGCVERQFCLLHLFNLVICADMIKVKSSTVLLSYKEQFSLHVLKKYFNKIHCTQ